LWVKRLKENNKKIMANKKDNNIALEVGLTVAAIAAAAGAVFLFGTDSGKKKRKEIKSWSLKAKAEVLEKIEKMKDVTEESYAVAVDAVAQKYSKIKSIESKEIQELVSDLKKSWKDIKKITSPKKAAQVKKAILKPVAKKK